MILFYGVIVWKDWTLKAGHRNIGDGLQHSKGITNSVILTQLAALQLLDQDIVGSSLGTGF